MTSSDKTQIYLERDNLEINKEWLVYLSIIIPFRSSVITNSQSVFYDKEICHI